jgi:ankyrin repeat protein
MKKLLFFLLLIYQTSILAAHITITDEQATELRLEHWYTTNTDKYANKALGVQKLYNAFIKQDSDEIKRLLKQELVDINGLTEKGHPPIALAIAANRYDVVWQLVIRGADADRLFVWCAQIFSPLSYAKKLNTREIEKYLRKAGAKEFLK